MIEQGSEEWFAQRLGKVTSSRISDVMAKGKGSAPSATRNNYMAELVSERLTGRPYPSFTSVAMQRGTEMEAACREAYELRTGVLLEDAGFVDHPEIAMSGASPDALIGDDGLYEAKNPNTATHLRTLLGEPIQRDYMLQMQWQLVCTRRAWCDWVSYDNRLPEDIAMVIRRVERNEALIQEITSEVKQFLLELHNLEVKLRGLKA